MNTIKPQELRIGNYVWENYGGYYIVRGIPNEKEVTISKTKTTVSVDFDFRLLNAIPLTEEILLRYGFSEDGIFTAFSMKISHNRILGIIDGKLHLGQNAGGQFQAVFIGDCKYLHQLQNTYYDIEREELTVTS